MTDMRQQLEENLDMLNRCIAEVERRAVDEFDGMDPALLRSNNGDPLLSPLLVAKAQTLSALASLDPSGRSIVDRVRAYERETGRRPF